MATNAENAKRIDELQASLAAMQEMMKQLLSMQTAAPSKEEECVLKQQIIEPEVMEWKEPDGFQTIQVRSLFNGTLNLRYGDNSRVTFNKYGDTQPVLYRDLTQIVISNNKFATEGYFEVTDKNAIHALSLDRYYTRFLSYAEIEDIFSFNQEELTKKIPNLTDYQKTLIVSRIAEMISDGMPVDYNKLNLIEKLLDVHINDKVAEITAVKDLIGRK